MSALTRQEVDALQATLRRMLAELDTAKEAPPEPDTAVLDRLSDEIDARNRIAGNDFKMIVYRFGAIVAFILFVAGMHVLGGHELFYLDNALWLVPVFAGIGVWTGLTSYNAFRPLHHNHHGGAVSLVWAMGLTLLAGIVYLMGVFAVAQSCLDPAALKAGAFPFQTAHVMPVEACATDREGYLKLYAVLSPWQAGIGAGIGLLGLAWATLYRSVYEDWKAHDTLDVETFAAAQRKAAQSKESA